ncbi:MAG: PAS domain-containing sensor histidine kinase [Methyloligellaceae bacterium]
MRGFAAYFRSLVHESARPDAMTRARHQSFIASHLIGGLLAICVFPVYLAVVGRPTMLSAFVFVWFLSPIGIAVFLSKTGRLAAAHFISAANLAGLVTVSAGLTGGPTSFLIPWMIIVPLEAALSSDRRVLLGAIGIACLGLVVLTLGAALDLLPPPRAFSQDPALLALLGSISAIAYGGGLAVSVQIVHKESEQIIRAGEKRYRLLAENSTDMITRHNASGDVVFASIASMQIFGMTSEKLLVRGLFERVHVADRPAYLNALSRCIGENVPVSVEFRVKRRSAVAGPDATAPAEYGWVEMRCKPILHDRSRAAGARAANEIVAVTRDITDRKAQEVEVLRARDEAESASQAKTHFLANMSHELRTPLNAIIGFSEILNRELFGRLGEDRYRDYARLIQESGEHLLSVVNEILDMSKIEAGKFNIVPEPFDVAGFVRSNCELMRHGAEQRAISLETDVAADLPELVADKRACTQMLLNLLSNAIKFTEQNGRVTVRARRSADLIEIIVADNGIGIASEDLPKLGNPFVQAESSYDRSYEGAGLGLSVVKGLARLHGGELNIQSQQGRGTTVTISLPIECKSAEGHIGEPSSEADNVHLLAETGTG